MAEILQNDALFLEYDEKSRNKLRSAFRLPPLYTGEAQEYNRATADTARKITEEQVFQPERKTLVNKLNTLLLPELNIHDVRLTLKGPDFRDPLEIAKVLGPFITAGRSRRMIYATLPDGCLAKHWRSGRRTFINGLQDRMRKRQT